MAIVTTPQPSRRQLARPIMKFTQEVVPYINWDTLCNVRQQLFCDMFITQRIDGGLDVEFSWPADTDEKPD